MSTGAVGGDLDPLLWAKEPRSTQAFEAVVVLAKDGNETFQGILSKLVEDGICTADYRLEYVWSLAEQGFVRPAWYVRANCERAA